MEQRGGRRICEGCLGRTEDNCQEIFQNCKQHKEVDSVLQYLLARSKAKQGRAQGNLFH